MKGKNSLEIPYEGNEVTRAARQKIDDDIRELNRRIQLLRRKRNELVPIFVLPPEVLSNIFVFVRDLGPSTGRCYPYHAAPWIVVGHVCCHWRTIALNYPNLWSAPVFHRANLYLEMMQRSKMAPLTIVSSGSSPEILERLENTLAQTTRLQSIQITLGRYSQRLEAIFSLFSQPTPLLENFVWFDPTDSNRFFFPPDTFPNAPRLRSINLNGFKISWESAIFKYRGLTNLRLTNTLSGTSTMGQMMDTLHHLPNLRALTLRDSIPPYTASDGNIRTVDFKFLERLEVTATAVDCASFLHHIQYPSSTPVTLYAFLNSIEDGVTTVSLLGQHASHPQRIKTGIQHPPTVIRSAKLTSGVRHIKIAFSNHKIDCELAKVFRLDNLDPTFQIFFLAEPKFLVQAHGRLLTSVSHSFDFSSLEYVLLDWDFTSDHIHAIRDSLGKLPKLKVIDIFRSFPEICIALAGTSEDEKSKSNPTYDRDPSLDQGTSRQSPPVLFPTLDILLIRNANFRQYQQQDRGTINHLIDTLVKRSNANMPINNLILYQCHGIRTWQTKLLGELVVYLHINCGITDVRKLRDGMSSEDDWDDEDDDNEDENDHSDNESP